MSNLPITNRSSDSKSNSFLSSFFGQKALDNFFQDFSSHFPFSKEFSGLIDTKLDFVTPKVDIVERKKGTKFHISFSYQNESTDTISVTPQNDPFRDENGELYFRPSGHGALLQNLNFKRRFA